MITSYHVEQINSNLRSYRWKGKALKAKEKLWPQGPAPYLPLLPNLISYLCSPYSLFSVTERFLLSCEYSNQALTSGPLNTLFFLH